MRGEHEFFEWHGVPVCVEWYDGPIDVSAITAPAEHPTGKVPEGERHALVEVATLGTDGWWATEDAVAEHAEPIGPGADETGFDTE